MKIQIEITMSEITPETKVKMSFKDAIIALLAVIGFTFSALTYTGVIPQRANGQVVDPITKTEVETTYVKKEKLVDTVNLVDQKIQSLAKEINDLSKKQDKMDDKLDKIIDKLSKP